jgi:endo-1,4-beta-xylanase
MEPASGMSPMKLALRVVVGIAVVLLVGWVSAASAGMMAAPAPRALAAELAAKAPTGVLPADLAATMEFRDDLKATAASSATWVADGGGLPVLRVESATQLRYADQVSVKWTLPQGMKAGDVVLVRMLVRVEYARQESGEGVVELTLQQPKPEMVRHHRTTLPANSEWTLLETPFVCGKDIPAGEGEVVLGFAMLPQRVEIAGFELLNFAARAKLDEMPELRFTYRGREEGAAWRKAALERIEKTRTAPIELRVIDAAGKPVVDAGVEIRLARPAFNFCAEVNAATLLQDTPDARKYREVLLEMFDSAVIGNGMKWPKWSGSAPSRAEALAAADWIVRSGLRMRGHCLVWPGDKFSPRRIVAMPAPREGLSLLIQEHIRDLVTATRGRMYAWDVINEMIHERDYFKYLPESEAAVWFKVARESDSHAKLVLNDYAMLNSPRSPVTIAAHVDLARRLMALGAPIDVLGVQGHVGRQVRNPEDVLRDLDLLAASGLEIQITEFDINTTDLSLQADYTRDFLIAVYSHPSVTGFTKWGFWQKQHWKPDAAMFNADWSEKPNAKVWRDLVRGEWLTKVSAKTDSAGVVSTRGHLGDYEFTVTAGEKVARQMRKLTSAGGVYTLQIP